MLKLFQKKNGAVSIFLVIILVPMITVTALFVDASRMKLSQSLVKSAGDLTLNTVMTQYDQDLNGLYGMMASCQNMDDVLKQAEAYLEACITSQGVNTTDAKRYATQISGLFFEDESITDVLDIELTDSQSIITAAGKGDLTNPALIKTQIVDFMKYRSPINAAAELLDSLKDMSDQVERLPDETDMTDKKNTFYENEEDVNDLAQQALKDIRNYTGLNITDTYIKNMMTNLDGYKEAYKSIHTKIVYDLYNSQDKSAYKKSKIKTNPTATTKFSSNNKSSARYVKEQVHNTVIAIKDYLAAKNKLVNDSSSISYGKGTYNLQYWVHMTDVLSKSKSDTNYVSKANSLCKKMINLQNAVDYCSEKDLEELYRVGNYDGVNTAGERKLKEHYNSIKLQYDSIVKSDFNSSNSTYNELTNRLVTISNTAINGESSIKKNNCRKGSTAETHIKTIHTEINDYYEKIDKGYNSVDVAVKKLEKLKEKVSDYHSSFKEWKTAANKSSLDESDLAVGTSTVKGDRKEIEEKEKSNILTNVTEENVQGLIDRLNNIKSLLGTVRKAIKNYKYNKTAIKDIDTLDKAKKKSGISEKNISTVESEISSYANSSFKFTEGSGIQNITANNNPDIDNVSKPPFYDWLNKNVKIVDSDKDSGAKKSYKEFKKQAEEEAKGEDTGQLGNGGKEIKNSADQLPSKGGSGEKATKSGKISEVSSKVSSLFGDLSGTLGKLTNSLMNNLYVTDYIISMFSYDTFEKEGKYNLAIENNPNLTYEGAPSAYEEVADTFNDEKKTNTENKSLTNNLINDEYCYSYGNEVEYILYGGENSQNKKTAYANIYMLRFAFDMIPVFSQYLASDSEEGILTTKIAISINTLTQGIVPIPLVKMVICLAATAMEAAKDLQYIKRGFGIKLLKQSDEIFTQISKGKNSYDGTLSTNTGGLTHGNKYPYLQYSDYLTLFLVIKQLTSSSANKIYLRTADVIQANVGKVTGQDGYYLGKSQVYYKLKVDFKVSPLMLTLPVIDDKNWANYKASGWNEFTYEEIRGY